MDKRRKDLSVKQYVNKVLYDDLLDAHKIEVSLRRHYQDALAHKSRSYVRDMLITLAVGVAAGAAGVYFALLPAVR